MIPFVRLQVLPKLASMSARTSIRLDCSRHSVIAVTTRIKCFATLSHSVVMSLTSLPTEYREHRTNPIPPTAVVEAAAQALAARPSKLEMVNCRLTGQDTLTLVQDKSKLFQLKALNLSGNALKDIRAASEAISSLQNLQEFRIGRNRIGNLGVIDFA
jgi:Leucine-rich repeat (LRR) protein